jgi:hypothetical protein
MAEENVVGDLGEEDRIAPVHDGHPRRSHMSRGADGCGEMAGTSPHVRLDFAMERLIVCLEINAF